MMQQINVQNIGKSLIEAQSLVNFTINVPRTNGDVIPFIDEINNHLELHPDADDISKYKLILKQLPKEWRTQFIAHIVELRRLHNNQRRVNHHRNILFYQTWDNIKEWLLSSFPPPSNSKQLMLQKLSKMIHKRAQDPQITFNLLSNKINRINAVIAQINAANDNNANDIPNIENIRDVEVVKILRTVFITNNNRKEKNNYHKINHNVQRKVNKLEFFNLNQFRAHMTDIRNAAIPPGDKDTLFWQMHTETDAERALFDINTDSNPRKRSRDYTGDYNPKSPKQHKPNDKASIDCHYGDDCRRKDCPFKHSAETVHRKSNFCGNCGKQGHYKRDCKATPKEYYTRRGSGRHRGLIRGHFHQTGRGTGGHLTRGR